MSRFSFTAKKKSSHKPTAATAPATSGAAAPEASTPAAVAPAAPGPAVRTVGHEAIAHLAYEIWVKRGRVRGQDLQNWREAETQLRSAPLIR